MKCPILSLGYHINPSHESCDTDCMKEQCAWWIEKDSTYEGECTVKRIALGKRTYYTGPN